MKKGIVILGLSLLVSSVFPVTSLASRARHTEEPKDVFVLFSWRLDSDHAARVQWLKKELPVAPKKKPLASRPIPKPVVIFKPRIIQPVITSGSSNSNWNVALASEFGGPDGLYYSPLACGGKYYPGIVGVANKSLPCGTRVIFKYHGNIAVIRVVDRGPYCCGRSWDFTIAAANLLGFDGVGTVYWKLQN